MKEAKRPPLKQKLPDEVVGELLGLIRNQFCPDMPDTIWFRDNAPFIKARVILWPASFMVGKGFTVPGERYLEILRGIIRGIQQHGQTANIKHWPRYLAVCVQRHFQKHWEEYYNEAKSAAALTDAAILGLKALKRDSAPDGVSVMAATHRLLLARTKRQKGRAGGQGELAL